MIKEHLFWAKVNKTESCWLWTGAIAQHNGYGAYSVRIDKKLNHYKAHRYSLICTGIKIPKEMVVDHICRVRLCVNPEHLRIVTKKVNALENSFGRSAVNKSKTHCSRGHEYNTLNTSNDVDKFGQKRRRCKTCRSLHSRKLI